MRWELISRRYGEMFEDKLPAGKYYIGDPDEMLMPGVLTTANCLGNGVFRDFESDSYIAICQFEYGDFLLNDDANDILVSTKSGNVAIMSENIVQQLPEFDNRSISYDRTFVIVVDIDYCNLSMSHDGREVRMYAYNLASDVDETDEQMYAREYHNIGVHY